ncbi:MAG TPA: hypothetical protein VIR03_03715, partial [Candidatus Saccharimonadales bacterium]
NMLPPLPAAAPVPGADLNSARDAVAQAINAAAPQQFDPIQALNAQPVNLPMGHADVNGAPEPAAPVAQPWTPPEPQAPAAGFAPASTQFNPAALNIEAEADPNAPPEVPPPMLPPANPY